MKATRDGLRRLGVSWIWQIILPPIINGALGYLTQKKMSFEILVDQIHEGKHPFDTGVFADDGNIDEVAFEAFVARGGGGPLTAKEMWKLIVDRGNHRPQMGKVAGALGKWFSDKEVKLLFCLAADTTKQEDGKPVKAVTPATLRRLYEGHLFFLLERRRRIRAFGSGPASPPSRQTERRPSR